MSDQLARDLEIMVTLFQSGGWSALSIETLAFSLVLSSDTEGGAIAASVPRVAMQPSIASVPPVAAAAERDAVLAPISSPCGIDPTWLVMTAPNLGTFYRSPKPGAPPFVEVGQRVEPGMEICLIEVMKLFTSVTVEVAGTVRHIAVADADVVEGGQALIYLSQD
ncbi:acetyl- biotin carboxyl carrier protein [Novosphingobium sp. Rr 2-17]|uniref:acetyl-CoA carboxylase biotin carboxyl carrier protein n=1 Tax=Novosphingobium sp. Rr 2-17 TaxID=555793 RepID=UPI000269AB9F|nr:biotin/lipoyl-containing protein [Novosphingobium sp. Rr 2-17]EIZ77826.1 acetyl- biotin carboxyl carrier protein [Novosphingobium sp. Rr 2-17]